MTTAPPSPAASFWILQPNRLLDLYRQQQWDALSEEFLQLLDFFRQTTYLSLDPQQQYAIDAFVKHFLYLFSQEDYIIGDRYVEPFLAAAGLISNLVAISHFKTTDPYLALLEQQKNNFVKLLTLYSARNSPRYSVKALFDISPAIASQWYCHFFDSYYSLCANDVAYRHLQSHMAAFDDRLDPLVNFHHMNFAVTYIDPEGDRPFKAKLNAKIRQMFTGSLRIENEPKPQRIGVISGNWYPQHSVYRILQPFVAALQAEYEVVLYYFGSPDTPVDRRGFAETYYLPFENGHLELNPLLKNDLMLVYYPDVGMNLESILLSNLRLAPIQVLGYGHPVSTFGSEIDYFIGGAAVEVVAAASQNYSERLVLIPGLGLSCVRPQYQPQYLIPSKEPLIINCSWYFQKINYPLLCLLKEILELSNQLVVFQFFAGYGVAQVNNFLPFVADLQAILGAKHVRVVPPHPYADYMALMEEGAFALDAYPFGGGNTVVDALVIGKPIVTYEGQKWYNRIGSALLRQVGLEELVASDRRGYIERAMRLITDHPYRQALSAKIRSLDLDALLFSQDDGGAFRRAIAYLIAHHPTLQADPSREPILMS
ncbi:O-linked N-acetylglucosamine transferase family protein [Parathermosynechococcus lividus]